MAAGTVAALQTLTAMLAFVTICLGLTKALVEAGILKNAASTRTPIRVFKKAESRMRAFKKTDGAEFGTCTSLAFFKKATHRAEGQVK